VREREQAAGVIILVARDDAIRQRHRSQPPGLVVDVGRGERVPVGDGLEPAGGVVGEAGPKKPAEKGGSGTELVNTPQAPVW